MGNKIYAFAVACVAILAVIGGTAYLFYDGHILFGVTNILLACMAYPYVARVVRRLWDESAD